MLFLMDSQAQHPVRFKVQTAIGKMRDSASLDLSKGRMLAGVLQDILGPKRLHAFFQDFGSFAACPVTPTHLLLHVPEL
jgi:hypothetical protein